LIKKKKKVFFGKSLSVIVDFVEKKRVLPNIIKKNIHRGKLLRWIFENAFENLVQLPSRFCTMVDP